MNIISNNTPLNGRLGKSCIMSLNTYQSNSNINILVSLDWINKDTIIQILDKLTTITIFVDNEVKFVDSIDLDFKYNNRFVLEHSFNNINKPFYTIKVVISFNDSTFYFKDTELENSLYVTLESSKIPSLLLNGTTKDNKILTITVKTNTKFDFIEYKLNDNKWIKFNSNIAQINISNLSYMYVKARGKYNGKYYYSNLLK